ncbi:MAG: right-handed parallel beta-helix repeat-containing protein [Anaerolineae bacterium]|nr:right-handed parallel beta-helix repeat-containing protein [Anaerolineae bacterium]
MITPTNGLVITEDTTLAPGVYFLPNGITIASDNLTLDGNGAVLVGQKQQGCGLTLFNQKQVTVKNLGLQGYYHGIYANRCDFLTITGCTIRHTGEIRANTIFLDIWRPADKPYGGAIYLRDVRNSTLSQNDLQHQMNGLLSYHCRQLRVVENNASYNSGFGFHLYETSDSLFQDNVADYCCRYEPRGEKKGHLGADAAAFLLVYGSSRNLFRRNLARLSGDGFFLAGLPPEADQVVGCDFNEFEENDASYSPNIGFEATFSRRNVYRNNTANFCNYGFWLGFSREFILEDNEIRRNHSAGVAVENGFGMQVRRNRFYQNRHGVLLWSRFVQQFSRVVPENDTSRAWLIEANQFIGNEKAIRIAANQDHGTAPLSPGTPATPKPFSHVIRLNDIQKSQIGVDLHKVINTVLEGNRWVGNGRNVVEKE